LGGGAQQQGLGVGDDGAEVGQGAQSNEDDGQKDVPLKQGKMEDDAQDARVLDASGGPVRQAGERQVDQNYSEAYTEQQVGFYLLDDGQGN
jgi:hypothetical protein